MKKHTQNQVFQYLLLLILSLSVSGCDDCSEPEKRKLSPLPRKLRFIIPSKNGETLNFKDNSGNNLQLVCLKNRLETVVESHYRGTKHSCDDTDIAWERQIAEFTGNLTTDDGVKLDIQTSIGVSMTYGESAEVKCVNTQRLKFFFIKIKKQDHTVPDWQHFGGYVDENSMPVINNFTFKEKLKLEGRLYDDINCSNIPPCTNNYGMGLDSVYYSTKLGLIRLTTTGGKKYQRVL